MRQDRPEERTYIAEHGADALLAYTVSEILARVYEIPGTTLVEQQQSILDRESTAFLRVLMRTLANIHGNEITAPHRDRLLTESLKKQIALLVKDLRLAINSTITLRLEQDRLRTRLEAADRRSEELAELEALSADFPDNPRIQKLLSINAMGAAQITEDIASLESSIRIAKTSLEEFPDIFRSIANAILESIRHTLYSVTDKLTGVLSRHGIAEFMERTMEEIMHHAQMEKRETSKQPISSITTLFFDLNNFKAINDDIGYTAGDFLLQMLGKALNAATRTGEDAAGRDGGDEFRVLLITRGKSAAPDIETCRKFPMFFTQYVDENIDAWAKEEENLLRADLAKSAETGGDTSKTQAKIDALPRHVAMMRGVTLSIGMKATLARQLAAFGRAYLTEHDTSQSLSEAALAHITHDAVENMKTAKREAKAAVPGAENAQRGAYVAGLQHTIVCSATTSIAINPAEALYGSKVVTLQVAG